MFEFVTRLIEMMTYFEHMEVTMVKKRVHQDLKVAISGRFENVNT